MNPYWEIGIVTATGLQAQTQHCKVNVYMDTDVRMPFGMAAGHQGEDHSDVS
jgi:hypothetical protein